MIDEGGYDWMSRKPWLWEITNDLQDLQVKYWTKSEFRLFLLYINYLVFDPINPVNNFKFTNACHNWNRPIDNPFCIPILILMYEE